jgi:uncharacterized protein with HEPN domain
MPHEQRDESYLWDMLESARAILEFTRKATLEEYCENRLLRLAVERALEIIGEAASHISSPFRAAHPEIPWRQIIGQRNVLIHEYGEVDDERIWNLVAHQIPKLIEQLSPLIPNPPDDIRR